MKKTALDKLINRNNIRERILGAVVPRVCPLCGELTGNVVIDEAFVAKLRSEAAGEGGSERLNGAARHFQSNPYICPDCYDKLDMAAGRARCMKCSRPLEDDTEEYCRDCRKKERMFDRGVAVMMHNEEARKILYGLKYGNMKDNADFLGYEAVCRLGLNIKRMQPDAVIPVPLHRSRLRKRGYNQAQVFAEKFCIFMEIAGFGRLEIDTDYIERTGKTLPLSNMTGSERAANLRNAFRVTGDLGRYKSVLLVDDIFTTGATLNECAKTLRQAGVNMVYFMTASIGS